ncbi:BnaA09g52660D [Brassica napus]|uniref:BnaA09g52660D protein n=1 Tax=Brassica napus TaxID=3708 RepID=A0A078J3P3_BRANA|nr:BnaA09g52660D [Brassica napus]
MITTAAYIIRSFLLIFMVK